jgi:hypothetical protein
LKAYEHGSPLKGNPCARDGIIERFMVRRAIDWPPPPKGV